MSNMRIDALRLLAGVKGDGEPVHDKLNAHRDKPGFELILLTGR